MLKTSSPVWGDRRQAGAFVHGRVSRAAGNAAAVIGHPSDAVLRIVDRSVAAVLLTGCGLLPSS